LIYIEYKLLVQKRLFAKQKIKIKILEGFMSYYGISVIITILLTSLIAFYLLYKAKELNLGILISITTGSIVLGFSFSPAFKLLLRLLSESISINRKLALVLALFIVLFVFLIFICVLSLIISIAIPKKFSSIDCGIYIEKFLAATRHFITGIPARLRVFASKGLTPLINTVRNTYILKNKLKKPVDTVQIIDKMGIEKSENGISPQPSSDLTGISEEMETAGYVAAAVQTEAEQAVPVFEEVEVPYDREADDKVDMDQVIAAQAENEVYLREDNSDLEEEIRQENEAAQVEDSMGALEEPSEHVEMMDDNTLEDLEDSEDLIEEIGLRDSGDVESPQNEAAVDAEAYAAIEVEDAEAGGADDYNAVQFVSHDEFAGETEPSAGSLVMKAFESKDKGRKDTAVEYYLKALEQKPDREMIFWIVLDVCTLYKQLGRMELARNILEGMVEKYGTIIQPEIKEEIIKNLK